MFKHDLEKIGSAVSEHSSGFSARKLAENPGTPAFWMYAAALYEKSDFVLIKEKFYLCMNF